MLESPGEGCPDVYAGSVRGSPVSDESERSASHVIERMRIRRKMSPAYARKAPQPSAHSPLIGEEFHQTAHTQRPETPANLEIRLVSLQSHSDLLCIRVDPLASPSGNLTSANDTSLTGRTSP